MQNTTSSIHIDREQLEALSALLRGEEPALSTEKLNILQEQIQMIVTHTSKYGEYHLYLSGIKK